MVPKSRFLNKQNEASAYFSSCSVCRGFMLCKPDISTEQVIGLLAFTSFTNSFFHTTTLVEKGTPYILSQTFCTQFGPLCPFPVQPSEVYAWHYDIWGFHSNEHSFYGLLGSGRTPLTIHSIVIRPKGHNWTFFDTLHPVNQTASDMTVMIALFLVGMEAGAVVWSGEITFNYFLFLLLFFTHFFPNNSVQIQFWQA